MSQDIAAVIMIFAATVLPVAINLSTKRRRGRSRPGTMAASRGIRLRAGYAPRHMSTGRRATVAPAGAGQLRRPWAVEGLPR